METRHSQKKKGYRKTYFVQQWSVIRLRLLPAPGLALLLWQRYEGIIRLLLDYLPDLIPGERD